MVYSDLPSPPKEGDVDRDRTPPTERATWLIILRHWPPLRRFRDIRPLLRTTDGRACARADEAPVMRHLRFVVPARPYALLPNHPRPICRNSSHAAWPIFRLNVSILADVQVIRRKGFHVCRKETLFDFANVLKTSRIPMSMLVRIFMTIFCSGLRV